MGMSAAYQIIPHWAATVACSRPNESVLYPNLRKNEYCTAKPRYTYVEISMKNLKGYWSVFSCNRALLVPSTCGLSHARMSAPWDMFPALPKRILLCLAG